MFELSSQGQTDWSSEGLREIRRCIDGQLPSLYEPYPTLDTICIEAYKITLISIEHSQSSCIQIHSFLLQIPHPCGIEKLYYDRYYKVFSEVTNSNLSAINAAQHTIATINIYIIDAMYYAVTTRIVYGIVS